ncbi:MAG TPA: hypothetical protein VMP10_04610, partial [Chloroflexota bacterium]|nr:hypothetical protein [Chloroflexota bacterium]
MFGFLIGVIVGIVGYNLFRAEESQSMTQAPMDQSGSAGMSGTGSPDQTKSRRSGASQSTPMSGTSGYQPSTGTTSGTATG